MSAFSISGRIQVQTASATGFEGEVFRDELEAAKMLLFKYVARSGGRVMAGHRLKEAREAVQAVLADATNEFFGD
ncbi:hypothetical protein hairong_109 [Pseudomonas phage hairong]|nr:hypothetical protein hairong_109 [Pseudomonas phage hairong]